jgi:glycerol-3-phosphate dehydrogenase (NAD(P)+)
VDEAAPLAGTRAPNRAVVVGAGSWGTAVARHLVRRGLETRLLCRRPEQAQIINRDHRNPDYLADVPLPPALHAAPLGGEDLTRVDLVVLAVPSKAYAATAADLAHRVRPGVAVLSLTKGVEPGSLRRLSVVIEECWHAAHPQVAVLTGPNHAEEVSRDQPTATVIASLDNDFARRLQAVLSSDTFRAYVSDDLIGVEIASAVKNVIALATGMSDGVGYGDNARAALMTRGLAEMARLGVHLGANGHTFAGLAGMGDLIATCTSRHSRNRRAGELIAQGRPPERVEEELGMVAEGLTAAPAIHRLGRDHDVEMPITENVCAIIAGEKDVRTSVRDLMARPPRPEQV